MCYSVSAKMVMCDDVCVPRHDMFSCGSWLLRNPWASLIAILCVFALGCSAVYACCTSTLACGVYSHSTTTPRNTRHESEFAQQNRNSSNAWFPTLVFLALFGFLGVFFEPLAHFFMDYGVLLWIITFVLIMMLAILLVWFILSTSSRPDSVRVRILHEMRQSLRHKYACGGIFCAPTWNAFGATVTHYHSLTLGQARSPF
jgi:NADH:ubiquinone oxidoreductase subunit 3 (subunit A)